MAELHVDESDHQRRTRVGSFIRRGRWIESNLVVGYYATFVTLLIVLGWADDEWEREESGGCPWGLLILTRALAWAF